MKYLFKGHLYKATFKSDETYDFPRNDIIFSPKVDVSYEKVKSDMTSIPTISHINLGGHVVEQGSMGFSRLLRITKADDKDIEEFVNRTYYKYDKKHNKILC